MIPTAMQQRLQWKPVKGAAFRRLTHFLALLKVYYFVTGKRYERKPVKDPRKECNFVCHGCEKGRVGLRIHRLNAKTSWWVVQTVTTCNCGSPSKRLKDLQLHGPTALVGHEMEEKSDWQPLAHACFPHGYVRQLLTSRTWDICCQRKQCPGCMRMQLQYVRGGRKYDRLRILSVFDCDEQCKQAGNENGPVPVRAPGGEDRTCLICTQDQLEK